MLSIKKISQNAQEAAKYYCQEFQKEDYYVKGQEPPGEWHNGTDLSLKEEVTEEQLSLILAGKDHTGNALVRDGGVGKTHLPGWDFTFSAPKSVSLLYARSPELRGSILEAHNRAVHAAISYMERVTLDKSVKRVSIQGGKRVVNREAPKSIIVAKFQHRTSRELDPQLHTHCLLANMAQRKDGSWGALDVMQAYREKKAIGALYRADLCQILNKELGLDVEKDREFFRLVDVPKVLETEFSKRREQIKEIMNKRGWIGGRLAESATLLTRGNKKDVDQDALFGVWGIQLDKLGWNREQSKGLLLSKDAIAEKLPKLSDSERTAVRGRLAEKTLKALTARASTFTIEGLKTHFFEQCQTIFNAKEIEQEFSHYLSFPNLVRLGLDKKWRERFSTQEIMDLEKRMLDDARILNKDLGSGIPVPDQMQAISNYENEASKRTGKTLKLTEDQCKSVIHSLSAGKLKLIEGLAGSGKSFAMQAVQKAYELNGYKILGLAPTGKAAQNLADNGINAMTVDKFFLDLRGGQLSLGNKDIIIVDEAGMLGSRKTSRLLACARVGGAKLIMVGEDKQLQPVDAGGAFKALGKEFGFESLTTIYRQKEDWQRDAVRYFRNGLSAKALELYHERGLLCIGKDSKALRTTLVKDYINHRQNTPHESSIIIASTNIEASIINEAVRAELKKSAILIQDKDFVATLAIRGEKEEKALTVGERIIFLKNNRNLDVQNGLCGTITEIKPAINGDTRFLTVKSDTGKEIKVDLFRYSHLDYAYAVTVYKSQGSTVDQVFMRASADIDRESTYVAMSRQRIKAKLYAAYEDFKEDFFELAKLTEFKIPEKRQEILYQHSKNQMEASLSKSNQKDTTIEYDI